jgi:hypothetical protein
MVQCIRLWNNKWEKNGNSNTEISTVLKKVSARITLLLTFSGRTYFSALPFKSRQVAYFTAQALCDQVCGPRVGRLNFCAIVRKTLILLYLEEIKWWNYFHFVEIETGF